MRRRGITRRRLALVGAMCALGIGASPAVAEDAADSSAAVSPAEALARLAMLEVREAMGGLFPRADEEAQAREAHDLASALPDGVARLRLVAVTGRLLDASEDPPVERTCIETLAVLGEPAGFAYLRRFFTSSRMEAVRAAARTGSEEVVRPLRDLVDPEEPILAAEALAALAEVGRHSRARVAVLDALLDVLGSQADSSLEEGAGHGSLSGPLVRALGAVTGRDLKTEAEWRALVAKTTETELLASSPPPPAEPVEPASPALRAEVDAWAARARAHEVGRDGAALRADLEAMRDLAAKVADPGLRVPLAELVGSLLEGSGDRRTRLAAVVALGALRTPSAGRFLATFLETDRSDADVDTAAHAIAATARIRPPEAVPLLLAAVDQAGTKVAVQALLALGVYAREPGGAKVLVDLVDVVRRHRDDQPAVGRPPPCSPWPEGELARYQTLSALLTERLNLWTGRDVPRPSAWYALVDAHRDDPKALFLR